MKNNKSDKLLREKITSLDTLSGGIVYGKEAAWDKLQERLEQKPAKKIRPQYWMAAAAVLLLFVCIWAGYRQTGIEVAAINSNVINHTPAAPGTAFAKPKQEPVNENVKTIIRNPYPVIAKGLKHHRQIEKPKAENTAPIIANAPPAPVAEQKADVRVVTNTLPATPAVTAQMKVIHINELAGINRTPATAQEVINGNDAVVISRLPVAHINDVVREIDEIKEIKRGNRLVFRSNSLYREGYYGNEVPANTITNYQQPIFLKSIFNTQN